MSAVGSSFPRPWVVELLVNYEAAVDGRQKAVPAQVVEFVKMQNNVEDSQCPAAVVHISDRTYYIQAVITKEAKQRFEEEEEHFAFPDIKGKIVILKDFTVQFKAEEDLKNCEFYLRIQHFDMLPMETDSVDLLNCNMHPEVKKKIRTLWQDHMEELCMKDTGCSDGPLTQLLMVMNEENLCTLKSTVLECLSLQETDQQPGTSRASYHPATGLKTARWNAERPKSQTIFSVPLSLLIIPAEEVVALNNLAEWKDDFIVMSDHERSAESHVEDMSTTKESPCEALVTPQTSVSSPVYEEQRNESKTQPDLFPWDDLSFQCQSIASSSAETRVSPQSDESLETAHQVRNVKKVDYPLPDSSTPDDLLTSGKFCAEESTLRPSPQDAGENEFLSLFSHSDDYSKSSTIQEASGIVCKSPIRMDKTYEPDSGIPCAPKCVNFDYVKTTVSLIPDNLLKVDYFEDFMAKRMCSSKKTPLPSTTLSSKLETNTLDVSSRDLFGSEEEEDTIPESKNGKRATKRKHLTEDTFPEVEEELGAVRESRSHKAPSPEDCYKHIKGKLKQSSRLQKPILEFLGCQRKQKSNKATAMGVTSVICYSDKTEKAKKSKEKENFREQGISKLTIKENGCMTSGEHKQGLHTNRRVTRRNKIANT
ncbi:uncharacterized protein LOC115085032 [Rhinatrema bivittatum]|uniref:uncharacterized protein LOC115085032 n=1 Tax=Rhinatrema bivittatum TaxID=194408 RepID=UPI00112BB490|nr:uncharacterized protein LOC115085032 [Rhinatrema bivittatum]